MSDEIQWPLLPLCFSFPQGYVRGDCFRCGNREACRVACEALASDHKVALRKMELVSKIRGELGK
jgi:hypothetical protein